jgi:hypothetical protein
MIEGRRGMDLSTFTADKDKGRLLAIAGKCCIEAHKFNWYDSNFRRNFEAAKNFLAIVAPDRAEEFDAAFDVLRTDPNYRVQLIDAVFDPATFEEIVETVHALPYVGLEHYESATFGRSLLRRHPLFTRLQASLADRVSELVGERVSPCYNFLSLYRGCGRCEPHLDSPDAKWTLDICIEQSVEWPIFFSQVIDWPSGKAEGVTIEELRADPALKFESVVLTPNRAAIFSGSAQWHFREPIAGKRTDYCHLLFFHYVPEGAGPLVDPKQWAAHFGIPELDVLLAADELVVGRPRDL